MDKRQLSRIRNTRNRWRKIQDRFNELYHENRLRIDDVKQQISEEFGYSIRTIEEILKKDLTDEL